jgi:hypothetical protein
MYGVWAAPEGHFFRATSREKRGFYRAGKYIEATTNASLLVEKGMFIFSLNGLCLTAVNPAFTASTGLLIHLGVII